MLRTCCQLFASMLLASAALAAALDPQFQPVGVSTISGDGSAPFYGDVNGDGRNDLIYFKTLPSPGVICVWLNAGDGSPQPFPGPEVCSSISPAESFGGLGFGDVNGDGRVDAVVGDPNSDGLNMHVFVGASDGSFQHAWSLNNGPGSPPGVGLGDFNGDGRLDLVGSTGGALPQLSVVLNEGGGRFGLPMASGEATGTGGTFLTGDINRDGRSDLVYLRDHSPIGLDSVETRVRVNLGNGDGTFQSVQGLSLGTTLDDARLDFIDADSLPDLMVYGYKGNRNNVDLGGVRLFRNTGGQFVQMLLVGWLNLPNPAESAELADLNGDRRAEVVVVRRSSNDQDAFVWINDGHGAFPRQITLGARDYGKEVLAMHFGGNPLKDLVIFDDPIFGAPDAYLAYRNTTSFCEGDLNADARVDQADLGILLADWNCRGGFCIADLDGDGDTDQADLGILLARWTQVCP